MRYTNTRDEEAEMIWTSMDFGKHTGLTLPEALFKDPDWFFWMMEQPNPLKNDRSLVAQANDLLRKATSIRIPGDGEEEELEIEHMVDFPSRKYGGFLVVPASKESHQGSSQTLRRDHLDMSIPRQIAAYDKTGGKLLVKCMKPIYFGSQSARPTKQRCEAFFNDESNFYLD
ncbi:MAG: hypothetical protein EOP84_26125 [Verrucomicrobiaceae bacterium]|nr:MAG: hypothetical protein EOP84_26125 [Verrucomicrobiaceae bacterium]